MTPSRKSKPTPIFQRRAIGNLLRLADACIRDGQLLLRGGRSFSVATLVGLAAARMVEAVVISERGRLIPSTDAVPERLDDDNPIKRGLASLATLVHQEPPVLPDGRLGKMLDEAALRGSIDQAFGILNNIIEHFDVDLAGQDPAGNARPLRPEAVTPDAFVPVPMVSKPSRGKAPPEPRHPVVEKPKLSMAEQEALPRRLAPAPMFRAPATLPPQRSSDISSVSFWSLMERWGVADLDALVLLGHTGGLTKKGTRPRFKLNDVETDMLIRLREIDEALISATLDPRKWLREAIAAAPLHGVAPFDFLTQNKLAGARDLGHYIFRQGLRLSLGNS